MTRTEIDKLALLKSVNIILENVVNELSVSQVSWGQRQPPIGAVTQRESDAAD